MDKNYRKQLEQKLAITIAYFLRKTDERTADKMAKHIKSSSKELAKKFVKTKAAINEKILLANKAVKKIVEPAVKVVAVKSLPVKAKRTPVRRKKTAAKKKVASKKLLLK